MSPSIQHDIGGLSHLVEAATALTELVGRPRPSSAPKTQQSATALIIDEDVPSVLAKAINMNAKKKEIFPQKLMEILADTSLSDIVSWLPHGRSFVIIRPDLFCEMVLPKYLPPVDSRGSTKYPSFTRKLNRWGFRQATRGADTGAFHHPYFRRDQPELCMKMVCQKSRDRQSSSSQKRSLPPKKRFFAEGSSAASSSRSRKLTAQVSMAPPRPVSVIADDRSIGSSSITTQSSGSTSSKTAAAAPHHPKVVVTQQQQPTPSNYAATAAAAPPSTRAVLPFVSNDPKFVATTLRQRDEQEVLRAAQAMLYESFMQALQQQQQSKTSS